MKHRLLAFSLILSLTSSDAFSQRLKKADRLVHENLRSHISYLSDDKLQGRRAGTEGEKLASTYISTQFEKNGLSPKGESGWLQAFEINDGKQINPTTFFIVNDHDLKVGKDFFPLTFSPNTSLESAFAIALREEGVPWVIDLKEMMDENKDNPHYDLYEGIRSKANVASEKGATALIIHNSTEVKDDLSFLQKDRTEVAKIPVIYISKETQSKFFNEESEMLDIKLKIDIGDKKRTGHNVVGFIDNGASNTIVLGAHYDHLGFGEDGNSMIRTGEKMIHNGADDNASGTAALIELGRMLKHSKNKSNNYLLIAFSAEELGLNGSKYFTEHPTVEIDKINYMINMDMVGRLNDSSKAMTIGGYGTSPAWSEVMNPIKELKGFSIKYDSSGTGPSDHTSFYRKNIPVLFFFTGLHTDYHRPSDDFEKINSLGTFQIVKLINQVIDRSATKGKLTFTPTREQQTSTTARFSVSLGIMPDYTFNGTGVRADGISAGRAAEKAGLKTGDIIVQLGPHNISSVENYMQALAKFKKGDSTTVKFKRGEEVIEASVQF
ncbi:MAG: M20/M25/M40 family metallo-hydrolase [Flavitalea sp.]